MPVPRLLFIFYTRKRRVEMATNPQSHKYANALC